MKFTYPNLSQIEDLPSLIRFLSVGLDRLSHAINGGLSFADNLDASTVSVTFNTANVDTQITHGLKRPPIGYIVTRLSASAAIFDGAKVPNGSVTFLRASSPVTASILFF